MKETIYQLALAFLLLSSKDFKFPSWQWFACLLAVVVVSIFWKRHIEQCAVAKWLERRINDSDPDSHE